MERNNTFETQEKNSEGYSLIEVVIVVAVIIVMSTLSYSSYTRQYEEKQLEAEGQKLSKTLSLAKKKAESMEKACDTYAESYTVSWTSSGYTLTPNGCSAQSTHTLPSEVVILIPGSAEFKPYGLGNNSSCIILQHVRSEDCKKISLSESGTVTINDEDDCLCP